LGLGFNDFRVYGLGGREGRKEGVWLLKLFIRRSAGFFINAFIDFLEELGGLRGVMY
jgi:hypothetical protein